MNDDNGERKKDDGERNKERRKERRGWKKERNKRVRKKSFSTCFLSIFLSRKRRFSCSKNRTRERGKKKIGRRRKKEKERRRVRKGRALKHNVLVINECTFATWILSATLSSPLSLFYFSPSLSLSFFFFSFSLSPLGRWRKNVRKRMKEWKRGRRKQKDG